MTISFCLGHHGPHRSQDERTGLSFGCLGDVLVDANQMPGVWAALTRKLQWHDPPLHCLRPSCCIFSLGTGQIESSDMLRKRAVYDCPNANWPFVLMRTDVRQHEPLVTQVALHPLLQPSNLVASSSEITEEQDIRAVAQY